tara:strand:+ start:200 stop:592 length:393 start_codon:yes stop_codon:yes gene_type:complete
MPGTLGSLVAIPFGYLILKYHGIWLLIFTVITLIIISFFLISKYLQMNENNDPQEIIIDEFVGQLIALIFISDQIIDLFACFFLFRLFDILKIFPVNKAEKIPGAIGVIADDIVAGLMAGTILIIFNILG